MRQATWCRILTGLGLFVALCAGGLAQDANGPTPGRKIARRVMPVYPDLAKQIRLRGTVRLVAVVAPNGTVKDIQARGGNPLLLKSATEAVKQWKYVAAPAESQEVVEIHFEPQ